MKGRATRSSSEAVAGLRLLGTLWLREVELADLPALRSLDSLKQHLASDHDGQVLQDLGVAYQSALVAVPPYESVILDPSGLLMAPAGERVVALYRSAGVVGAPGPRGALPDHVGVELLVLADWIEQGNPSAATLHVSHLALWLPALCWSLKLAAGDGPSRDERESAGETPARRSTVKGMEFYADLATLSAELVLSTAPDQAYRAAYAGTRDPLPDLPPPPVYRASGDMEVRGGPQDVGTAGVPSAPRRGASDAAEGLGIVEVLDRLMIPRESGFYLGRPVLERVGASIGVPVGFTDRRFACRSLLETAARDARLSEVLGELAAMTEECGQEAKRLTDAYPHWQPVGEAWIGRLDETRTLLEGMSLEAERSDL